MRLSLGPALAVALMLPLGAFAEQGPAEPMDDLAALSPDPDAGQELYRAACAQCHGRSARGTAVFPGLQGQTAEDLAALLIAYRAGEVEGPNAALMMPVARDLDDQQIVDVSAWLAETYP